MIVHIGGNITLLEKDIVAILDIDSVLKSKDNTDLIENLIKGDCLVNYTNDNIKTYIIALDSGANKYRNKKNQYKLYVSNISSTSLLKRIYSSEVRMEEIK